MPLTRTVSVAEIPPQGLDVAFTADESGRAALAEEFDIPVIERLEGRYHLTHRSGGRVHVAGTVEAEVRRTCVVTLEPVDEKVDESVDVIFAPEESVPLEHREGIDPPDLIVNGAIDLGALTSEFLALGLDPYPRKPGVTFSAQTGSSGAESPFAALQRMRNSGKTDG